MSESNLTQNILIKTLEIMIKKDPKCALVADHLNRLILAETYPNVAALTQILNETDDSNVYMEGSDEDS